MTETNYENTESPPYHSVLRSNRQFPGCAGPVNPGSRGRNSRLTHLVGYPIRLWVRSSGTDTIADFHADQYGRHTIWNDHRQYVWIDCLHDYRRRLFRKSPWRGRIL